MIVLLEKPIKNKINPQNDYKYSTSYSFTNDLEAKSVKGESLLPTHIEVETYSYRAWILDEYFKKHSSPLEGKGQVFVDACNKYNAPKDCTLLPAIAKVETDLCKTDISARQYNCWGYGGSGENRIVYQSFEQAIDDITGRLMKGYGLRFFNNPEAGQLFYCGSHCDAWGGHVKSVQNDIKQYAISLGYEM